MVELPDDAGGLIGLTPCRVAGVTVALPDPFARLTLVPDDPALSALDIPISIEQGRFVALVLAKERPPRPMTAELMSEVLRSYGVSVVYVRITGIEEGNFAADIATSASDGRTRQFEARASDAVLLALLEPVPAPIMVHPDLLRPPEGDDIGDVADEGDPDPAPVDEGGGQEKAEEPPAVGEAWHLGDDVTSARRLS